MMTQEHERDTEETWGESFHAMKQHVLFLKAFQNPSSLGTTLHLQEDS